MSRPLKEAGFSLNQLDQRMEQLQAGSKKFDGLAQEGGRIHLFNSTKRMIKARGVGGAAFAEAVLEVGERRVVVLGIIDSISNGTISERLKKIDAIIEKHPAAEKITRIQQLQAGGYIGELDAIPAIDYLRDWVPDAKQEEAPESEEKILDAGAPVSVGRSDPDTQLTPEDESIAALRSEFRERLKSVKISPTPKRIIEALIAGGNFDKSNLMQRRALALAVYQDRSPEESLGALSFQMDAAKKAIVGVLNLEGKRAKGAEKGGYFLSFSQPS